MGATAQRLVGIVPVLTLAWCFSITMQPIALAFAPAPAGGPSPPLKNLNIVVLTSDARPIADSSCVVGGDRRAADGSGFINFGVSGSVVARCAAPGHISRQLALPPGDHRVHLNARARSAVVAPSACGPSTDPNENRRECARQIAAGSANWTACSTLGHDTACHRYVREVARALAAGDPRWGLISKPRGQQSCSETACGADVGGYGQDVAAYRPAGAATGEWIGFDLVAGAGAPGATVIWNGPLPRRADNLWATVPR